MNLLLPVTFILHLIMPVEEPPKLVWSDEFNRDGAPDPANWVYDVGNGDNGSQNSVL